MAAGSGMDVFLGDLCLLLIQVRHRACGAHQFPGAPQVGFFQSISSLHFRFGEHAAKLREKQQGFNILERLIRLFFN
jgi:hypothetical protein